MWEYCSVNILCEFGRCGQKMIKGIDGIRWCHTIFLGSSRVLWSSQRFLRGDAMVKSKISKPEGKRKTRTEIPVFPTKRYFVSTASLTHLPFRYLRYAYKSVWFLNTHAPMLSAQSSGSEFFVEAVWQRYDAGNVVI